MEIRKTEITEYRKTEELTREAFWNVYKPGCDEHLVLHNFRNSPNFIKDLDYVIIENDKIVAHIMYSKTIIENEENKIEVLMFGPISVDPKKQKQGFGSAIINYTLSIAKKMNYKAVIITGNPQYYSRFGFECCYEYRIGLDEYPKEKMDFFMIKILDSNLKLENEYVFRTPKEYFVSREDLEVFDKDFPKKIKQKKVGQLL